MPDRRDFSFRLCCIFLLIAVLSYLHRRDFIDDALIYARYIANACNGLGLVFNPGERVNALSSPFFSYLVLLTVRVLGGNVLAASVTVSAVALFGAFALAELYVPFAGLLLAATGFYYTLLGMETALFLALLLLPVLLLERGKVEWLPTAAVLLVLTRFEGAALLPPLVLALYRRKTWPSLAAYIPGIVILFTYAALNYHWYGAWFPASASAKLAQGRSRMVSGAFFGGLYQLKHDFLSTIYVPIAVVVLLIPGLLRIVRTSLLWIYLPFLAVLFAFYYGFNLPGFRWYFAPFIAFAMIFACAGLPEKRIARIAAVAVILCSAATAMYRSRGVSLPFPGQGTQGYPAIGDWLTRTTPAGTRVEAGEIGALGWYCRRCRIIDILGLTYPKNADHIAHRDVTSWLKEDNPDFVVVHRAPWFFEDVVKQSPAYERVPIDFGPTVYVLQRRRP